MGEVTKDLDSDAPAIGRVQWHCSEADSGPDVGILLGLGGEKMLWVGEMLDADGIGAMGMKVYYGNATPPAFPFEYDGVREVIEEHIAPVIWSQAEALTTAQAEIEALRGLCSELIGRSSFTYKARNGRECYIEDESGERCVLVPHEVWAQIAAPLGEQAMTAEQIARAVEARQQ